MATEATDFITWFKDIRKNDTPKVGEKGANLGEMCHVSAYHNLLSGGGRSIACTIRLFYSMLCMRVLFSSVGLLL